jgi:uncharacterized membrane protein
MRDETGCSPSFGFALLLTTVFVALKVAGWVDISWWFIFLPLIFYMVALALVLIAITLAGKYTDWLE